MGRCPAPSVLESLAAGGPAPRKTRRHVARCAACRGALEQMRENDRFLARVADDLADAIDSGPRARRAPPLPRPDVVPGYHLVEEISRGGQGVVYRAIQAETRRPAAIKMLLAGALASPRQRYRFERETELAARLHHPNIVAIFQSGVAADGARYVAMEFVRGVPLDRYAEDTLGPPARGGRARADAVMRLMLQVARGVGHAHTLGVIHRDLKPGNILVDEQGVARVLDFGLARTTEGAQAGPVTQDFAGTPAYAAPERLNGEHDATDARGDVYSLGLVLYRLLTGHAPYPCEGPLALVARHAAETTPVPPSRYVPRLPMDVQTIVLQCLAKDPARRYANASALAGDIEDYLAGNPIAARRESAAYVLGKLVLRNRAAAAAVAMVALTVVLAAVGFALLAADLDRSRRHAETALADSTVQRARLMTVAGDPQRAEALLWGEAIAAGIGTGEGALWHGTPEQLRSVWSLAEFYARLPRLMRARTGVRCVAVGLDADRGEVWAIDGRGCRWTWSLEGRFLERTAELTPWATTANASPNGRYVALEGAGMGRVWDVENREAIAPPFASAATPYGIQVDDLGRVLVRANVSQAGRVQVSDARTGAVLAECDHDTSTTLLHQYPDGGLELLVGTTGQPHPRVLSGRSPDWVFQEVAGLGEMLDTDLVRGIRRMAGSGDGRLLAVAVDCHLYLFERSPEPVLLSQVEAPTKWIDLVAFDSGDESVVVGGRDGLLARYAVPDLQQQMLLHAGHPPAGISISSVDPLAVLALDDDGVAVYALSERPWRTAIASTPVTHASIDVSGDSVLVWGDDTGVLHVSSERSPREAFSFRAHEGVITSVDFSPDGSEILSAGFDGTVVIHRTDGTPVRVVGDGLPRIACARFSPDGGLIAAGSEDGRVYVWANEHGAPPREYGFGAARIPMVEFGADGRSLLCATASIHKEAVMLDARTGELRHRFGGHGVTIRSVCSSPDGELVVTGGDDRALRVWNASTGTLLRTIAGLPWGPYDIAFGGDGSVLFVVGPGGSIIVIDPHAGVELAKLPVHDRHVFSIAISPDGARLYTSGEDPWIGVTDLDHLRGYIRGNEAYWRSAEITGEPAVESP